MAEVRDLGDKAIESLDLPKPVQQALRDVQLELAGAYREGFVQMTEAITRQASALDRIQATLHLLIQHVAPGLQGKIPAIQLAAVGQKPDLATALVAADPIAAGYTLTQKDLAALLGISQADVSILVRAFDLAADGDCAVTVRKGPTREWVNYNRNAVGAFLKLVANPPKNLKRDQQQALRRVQAKLITAQAKP
jgi:hypothetical protein